MVLGCQRGAGYRWASAIDLIYRIKMVVARASGTLIASSLKQNKFLTLKWRLRPVLFRGGALSYFFVQISSFFDNSFDRYPIGEKTEVADSEKRTPEVKFRPFFSNILVFPESHKIP